MRILIHSSDPAGQSGYSVVTKQLIKRLRKDGHFVRVATKHGFSNWQRYVDHYQVATHLKEAREALESSSIAPNAKLSLGIKAIKKAREELEGVEVFEGTNISIINKMIEREKFDYVFSLWDIWILHSKRHLPHDKWIAYIPIDTPEISDTLKEVCLGTDMPDLRDDIVRGPKYHIAMSKHGRKQLWDIGLLPYYAPHGVDKDVFYPDAKGRKELRDARGWTEDDFIVGSVGMNYVDDRKGYIPLIRAFKEFEKEAPEAKLYLHTHMKGEYKGTLDYLKIAKKEGLLIYLPDQGMRDLGRIDENWLKDIYNSMDLFCLPTRGEGFGIPIIEAMACGVPVLTTDTTSGAELVGDCGYLMPVRKEQERYLKNNTFRYEIGSETILDGLRKTYNVWKLRNDNKFKTWGDRKDASIKKAGEYNWDTIWEKDWKPIFEELEEKLKTK